MLTPKQTKAAALLAQGWLTKPQIAKRLKIRRESLYLWRQEPEFKEELAKQQAIFRENVKREGLADIHERIGNYNRLVDKLKTVIAERARDMKNVPGGKTGLMVRRYKSIGSGDSAEKVEEIELDGVLLKEFKALSEQVAKELGQLDRAGEDDAKPDKIVKMRKIKRAAD